MANCVVQFSTVTISQCPKTSKFIMFLSLLYVIRGIIKTILNLESLQIQVTRSFRLQHREQHVTLPTPGVGNRTFGNRT